MDDTNHQRPSRQPKLQLFLDDYRRDKLKRIAARDGVTMARVIRRLIDEAV